MVAAMMVVATRVEKYVNLKMVVIVATLSTGYNELTEIKGLGYRVHTNPISGWVIFTNGEQTSTGAFVSGVSYLFSVFPYNLRVVVPCFVWLALAVSFVVVLLLLMCPIIHCLPRQPMRFVTPEQVLPHTLIQRVPHSAVVILLLGPVLRQLGHRVVPHQRLHVLSPSDLVIGHDELLDQRRPSVLGEVVLVWFQALARLLTRLLGLLASLASRRRPANVVGGISYVV